MQQAKEIQSKFHLSTKGRTGSQEGKTQIKTQVKLKRWMKRKQTVEL